MKVIWRSNLCICYYLYYKTLHITKVLLHLCFTNSIILKKNSRYKKRHYRISIKFIFILNLILIVNCRLWQKNSNKKNRTKSDPKKTLPNLNQNWLNIERVQTLVSREPKPNPIQENYLGYLNISESDIHILKYINYFRFKI